mmetsp:Transcript_9884/g.24995  ORF Transcript_9884/g.24995 Transcript_9884/m.24995 type:complete len:296 (+) Transcript_9884:356-1243(+)
MSMRLVFDVTLPSLQRSSINFKAFKFSSSASSCAFRVSTRLSEILRTCSVSTLGFSAMERTVYRMFDVSARMICPTTAWFTMPCAVLGESAALGEGLGEDLSPPPASLSASVPLASAPSELFSSSGPAFFFSEAWSPFAAPSSSGAPSCPSTLSSSPEEEEEEVSSSSSLTDSFFAASLAVSFFLVVAFLVPPAFCPDSVFVLPFRPWRPFIRGIASVCLVGKRGNRSTSPAAPVWRGGEAWDPKGCDRALRGNRVELNTSSSVEGFTSLVGITSSDHDAEERCRRLLRCGALLE